MEGMRFPGHGTMRSRVIRLCLSSSFPEIVILDSNPREFREPFGRRPTAIDLVIAGVRHGSAPRPALKASSANLQVFLQDV